MADNSTQTSGAAGWLALGIVALAGFTDAVSYLQFRHVYVSFMSGNTTALGVAVAQADWPELWLLALVLALFVAGVALGTALHRAGGQHPAARGLAVVAGLLALAAAGLWPLPLLALGMGLVNASVRQTGPMTLGLTYVTGALVKVGAGLADRLAGRPWPPGWGRQLLDWACLAAGAVAGAMLWQPLGLRALLAAAGAALLLALAARRAPAA